MKLKPVGYFSKVHGLKGHLILFTSFDFEDNIKAFFIEKNGSQQPFFIEEMKPFKEGFLVKLEGIDRAEEASLLKNKEALADERFVFEPENDFELHGFMLVDPDEGEIGIIEELIDNPGNALLKITKGGSEVLLPFAEDLIIKVDEEKKTVVYKIPPGLLDIYLSHK